MSYQIQSQNGQVIEQINGKFYINGVEVETGKMSPRYFIRLIITSSLFGIVGFFLGVLIQL